TRDIADILDDYKKQGHSRMAQVVRTTLIDVFKEAQHAGEVPPAPPLLIGQCKDSTSKNRKLAVPAGHRPDGNGTKKDT
ncbi:hypothetical protein BV501_17355, partial [Erwinia sp. OAMSP11]